MDIMPANWVMRSENIEKNNEKELFAKYSERWFGLKRRTRNEITIDKVKGTGIIYYFSREFSDTFELETVERTLNLVDCKF